MNVNSVQTTTGGRGGVGTLLLLLQLLQLLLSLLLSTQGPIITIGVVPSLKRMFAAVCHS